MVDLLSRNVYVALAGVAQLVGVLSCRLKGHGFEPQSEHIQGNQCFSPLSLYPSLKAVEKCLQVRIKKMYLCTVFCIQS